MSHDLEHFDDTRWMRLRALFERAVSMDATHRDALLADIGAEDEAMAQALRELLAADSRALQVTARVGAQARAMLNDGALPASASRDARIGPYLLIGELGRGGMGVVFRARRSDGAGGEDVALKVIPHAQFDPEARRRFILERETIATLDHPNIARLQDLGETLEGAPYFVMPLIDGAPITTWCDQRRATLRARLQLFLRVCAAVQHAHGRRVLHRDLKPGNILVTDDGSPILIDFGIAKNLAIRDNDTRTAQRFFSPGNAAPEQLTGERPGPPCDVYQLGTVLHELLCGSTVFDFSGLAPAEIERTILDAAPMPPSERAASIHERGAIARGCGSGTSLARQLRGNLDAIVLRALRKDPTHRYPSVDALAVDIRLHLRGRRVSSDRTYGIRAHWRERLDGIASRRVLGAIALVAVIVAALAISRRDRADITSVSDAQPGTIDTSTTPRDPAATSDASPSAEATEETATDLMFFPRRTELEPSAPVAPTPAPAAAAEAPASNEALLEVLAAASRQPAPHDPAVRAEVGTPSRTPEEIEHAARHRPTSPGDDRLDAVWSQLDRADATREDSDGRALPDGEAWDRDDILTAIALAESLAARGAHDDAQTLLDRIAPYVERYPVELADVGVRAQRVRQALPAR